jgi:hypothetical protein
METRWAAQPGNWGAATIMDGLPAGVRHDGHWYHIVLSLSLIG